jgi:fructose-specific PTS system IIA-like component
MTCEYSFICPLKNGIHARPANTLKLIAEKYSSDILLLNNRNSVNAKAKSVLSIIGADIKQNDLCRLVISGNDENAAYGELVGYLKNGFAESDEDLPQVTETSDAVFIPPSLKLEAEDYCKGIAVVKGLAHGKAVILNAISASDISSNCESKESEFLKFKKATESLKIKISDQIVKSANKTEKKILEAHLSIATDTDLLEEVSKFITDGLNAGRSVIAASEYFSKKLKMAASTLIQQRIIDIQDVCAGLIEEIYGAWQKKTILTEPCVCVAQNLTPSQFLGLDKRYVKGLVMAYGGTTSHTVILARSFGIPTIVNVEQAQAVISNNQEIILDANLGIVVLLQNEQIKRYYLLERKKLDNRKNRLAGFIKAEGLTSDGRKLEIAANIASAEESEEAFANGAQGIGLFRTEMLYMQNENAPSEEEQFEIYKKVVIAAGQKPVIIRTLDIGGDKHPACLNLEKENNPFLGYRAVRIYPEFEKLIIQQLRAIIRASAFGRIKMLVPMICSVDEIRWVKRKVSDIQNQLTAENTVFDSKMPVGIMIEVPSTIFILDQLCDEADFFSIGTNDLSQYIFAVERENKKLSKLCDNLQPAFVRVLKTIIQQIHNRGKWVGMCGEMAGQIESLPLTVGLGMDEISLGSVNIGAVKNMVNSLSFEKCKGILESAIKCTSADEVRNILAASQNGQEFEIIDRDLIITSSASLNKEEAIKESVDLLFAAGRTEHPELIEQEVWNREAVYSTGLGYGFAIPHCKSMHTKANSICLLKFSNGIKWNPDDKEAVKILIMLVVKQQDAASTHMQVFSKLARKIMHNEFRDYLLANNDADGILKYLKETLEIK